MGRASDQLGKLVKHMIRKLKSKKGETLAESLMAVLIIAISSAGLAGMIMGSAKINLETKEADSKIYKAISYMEGHTASASEGKGTVMQGTATITNNSTHSSSVSSSIALYKYQLSVGGGNGDLMSYSYYGANRD